MVESAYTYNTASIQLSYSVVASANGDGPGSNLVSTSGTPPASLVICTHYNELEFMYGLWLCHCQKFDSSPVSETRTMNMNMFMQRKILVLRVSQ